MSVELTTIAFDDLCKLATVIWLKGAKSVNNAMMTSGMVKVLNIDQATGNTREFSSIDTNEYLSYKAQSDQAARGQVQQGLKKAIALVKSILINGESPAVGNAHERGKIKSLCVQRLNEWRQIICQAIVRTPAITT